jgi:hypothetical protein
MEHHVEPCVGVLIGLIMGEHDRKGKLVRGGQRDGSAAAELCLRMQKPPNLSCHSGFNHHFVENSANQNEDTKHLILPLL